MIARALLYALKLAAAGGLIGWLVASGRLDFAGVGANVASPYVVAGFAAYVGSIIPTVVRWRRLLAVHGLEFGLWRVARWIWIAEFFALVLPGGAGAELSRGFYVFRNAPGLRVAALSTVFLDRVFGLVALLFLGTLSFVVFFLGSLDSWDSLAWAGISTALLFVAGLALFAGLGIEPSRRLLFRLAPRRLRDPLEPVVEAYARQRRVMGDSFLLSLASQLFLMAAFVVAGRMVTADASWSVVFLVVPLIYISNYLPIAPGGIGVGEAAASFLFAAAGVANGAAIMLVVRLWIVAVQLSGGLVYLLHREPLAASPPGFSRGRAKERTPADG